MLAVRGERNAAKLPSITISTFSLLLKIDHGASEGARERGSPFEGTGSSLALFDEGSMSTNSSFACSDIAAEVPIAKMKIFTQNIYIKSFK
jgi:hypothetical protein